MLQPDKKWIVAGAHFSDIADCDNVIKIQWNKNDADDYVCMAESFHSSASIIITDILKNNYDNSKLDQWFFPAMYFYRQSIELVCKALILLTSPRSETKELFKLHKHNVIKLFEHYVSNAYCALCDDEKRWILDYLKNLEHIDKSSNLFRYPIRDGYLSQYKNDFLDIVDMANGFEQCYSIIFKCLQKRFDPIKYEDNIDLSMSTNVLYFANNGLGNCMLYSSIWDDGYHTHISGYSNVVEKLLASLPKNQWSFFAIAFLIRHAIELSLKRCLLSRTQTCVEEKKQRNMIRKHNLYQKLWISIKPMIVHYALANRYDIEQIEIADDYLKELNSIDTSGFVFRYPTNFDLVHQFNFMEIDYYHAIDWMISIFNFVDGCDDMLYHVYDCECDMRSYYM